MSCGGSPTLSVYRSDTTVAPVSAAIVSTMSRVELRLGEDRLDAALADPRHERGDLAGARILPGRVDHGAVDRQPVGRGEVRERVVERDDRPVRLGDGGELGLRVLVERRQPLLVAAEVGAVVRGAARDRPRPARPRSAPRRPRRRRRSATGGGWPASPGSSPARSVDARQVVAERDDRRLRPGVAHEVAQPVVQPQPVADDEPRVGDAPDVGRRGIERVHLAALGDEALDADPVAADLRGRGPRGSSSWSTTGTPASRRRRPPGRRTRLRRARRRRRARMSASARCASPCRRRLARGAQAEQLQPVGGDPEPRPPAHRPRGPPRGRRRRRRATVRSRCRSRGGGGPARRRRTRGRPPGRSTRSTRLSDVNRSRARNTVARPRPGWRSRASSTSSAAVKWPSRPATSSATARRGSVSR